MPNRLVQEAIGRRPPDSIVLNAGIALLLRLDPVILGRDDVVEVQPAAPHARLIATHMETLNRCVLSRVELRAFADRFSDRLLILADNKG